mmetsp:Transcript_20523/g.38737  ORF Transcript_20523/g.38737 Transcript_20523/m.38737 type:complete len:234 (-) Transcript_20523:1044-1745(-)
MMTMSSLHHRTSGATKKSSAPPSNSRNSSNSQSFETCFSAGLDLTEFGANNRNNGNNVNNNNHASNIEAASAQLAQQKMNAAARRNNEEKEEAALERRVADVADSAKFSVRSDDLGSVVPRAVHPNNATGEDHMMEMGSERDNNFVQFQDHSGNNGFLSSLVSGRASEERVGTISHKSRTLLKKKTVSRKQKFSNTSSLGIVGKGPLRRQGKPSKMPSSANRKAAKKARKSKY